MKEWRARKNSSSISLAKCKARSTGFWQEGWMQEYEKKLKRLSLINQELQIQLRSLKDKNSKLANTTKRLKNGKENEMCLICSHEVRNIIFIPCGHILYCNMCTENIGLPLSHKIRPTHPLSKCGRCQETIKKVYFAYPD
ncbi:unnamed protein product [Blepharisma stoltei]|uniref:RING-type domain-containing protein n=1 Tax=Blepharisma stoltei TaxID=1481888 RepID=A0AAU9JJL5_9CILI|nr:unnamed protein product [Blepharisma stoltei]